MTKMVIVLHMHKKGRRTTTPFQQSIFVLFALLCMFVLFDLCTLSLNLYTLCSNNNSNAIYHASVSLTAGSPRQPLICCSGPFRTACTGVLGNFFPMTCDMLCTTLCAYIGMALCSRGCCFAEDGGAACCWRCCSIDCLTSRTRSVVSDALVLKRKQRKR
jgi:hypothetical protein